MINIFIDVLAFAGTICTALGFFVLFMTLVLPKKEPMDSSNRLNHLRLVWMALKSPQKFVNLEVPSEYDGGYRQAFPWLERDEGDNV